MFEYAHEYGKFILRNTRGRVYDTIKYQDNIPNSMETARSAAQAWVDKMNNHWNRKAA